MNKTILIIIVITAGMVGLGVVLFNYEPEANFLTIREPVTELAQEGEAIPILEAVHISREDNHEAYNSNPPTSGAHLAAALRWGVYDTPLLDEQVLHSLEHGGIWISYKGINEQSKIKLEAIAKANSGSVILSPRPNNDSNIALASWGRLTKLESYDEQVILDFIRANKNKSPEQLAF